MNKVCQFCEGQCAGAIVGDWSREQCRLCWVILNPPGTARAVAPRTLTAEEIAKLPKGHGCCGGD